MNDEQKIIALKIEVNLLRSALREIIEQKFFDGNPGLEGHCLYALQIADGALTVTNKFMEEIESRMPASDKAWEVSGMVGNA